MLVQLSIFSYIFIKTTFLVYILIVYLAYLAYAKIEIICNGTGTFQIIIFIIIVIGILPVSLNLILMVHIVSRYYWLIVEIMIFL